MSKRAKKQSNIYFTRITDVAICAYNKVEDAPALNAGSFAASSDII